MYLLTTHWSQSCPVTKRLQKQLPVSLSQGFPPGTVPTGLQVQAETGQTHSYNNTYINNNNNNELDHVVNVDRCCDIKVYTDCVLCLCSSTWPPSLLYVCAHMCCLFFCVGVVCYWGSVISYLYSLQDRHSARNTPVCSARSALPPHWLYSDTDQRSDRLEHPSSGHMFLHSESPGGHSYRLQRHKHCIIKETNLHV